MLKRQDAKDTKKKSLLAGLASWRFNLCAVGAQFIAPLRTMMGYGLKPIDAW
jgi:hypothetical protein